ncbi:MAG: TRAP transporter small permease [Dehalococcoidia bacterium]|jgi:TRAP-type C4-dicarboxylate transport system permease small subunit|nr:TRAP transporter small permease [Dehalococcoidia bacterium]|tara:strand:+ start:89 stop:616 length:528 start_codon:yes stop_codon:yes gene_type:complete
MSECWPRRAIQRFETASRRVNEVLAIAAGGVTIAIMIMVVVDVSGRYLFNKPIVGGIEIEQIMLAYLIFFSFAYALVVGGHVRMTLILDRFGRRLRLVAELLAGVLGFTLFALLTWGGWGQFWESWLAREYMPASIDLPFWLPKLAVPIGVFLISVQFMVYFLTHLAQLTEKRQG